MRSLEDSSTRWQKTIRQASTLGALKLAVRSPGDGSPCVSGLRSVCWKVFLLFQGTDLSSWASATKDSRDAYKSLREHFLKYIERPEEIGSTLDPLDDDKNSPWNTLRQDEELRAEILQDVERCMPDEQFFRKTETQRILLDILFIFCKLNQDVGYRQGMHELLAPVLWVVELDALDTIGQDGTKSSDELIMLNTLDSRYIEHDAFTIFSLLMQSAKSFYELGEPSRRHSVSSGPSNEQNGASPIVERSKRIHEEYLAQVDPDLANHLTTAEVLPQIFLIRWIRLIFGREFPFDSLLTLWDTLFAEDPALDLIDMICVAMLLRIRWQLIDADYSIVLTLLLKYPFPEPPYGPQTFVEDALYLKKNLNTASGANIVAKYSGRAPSISSSSSRPMTPMGRQFPGRTLSPESKGSRKRSPRPSPARFLQQQGGVEALLQGAAKNVYDRGERLGINKAVRDAVGEVKKNLQGVSPSGSSRNSDLTRWSLDEDQPAPSASKTVKSMEQRNKQLVRMLQEALDKFRKYQFSETEKEKDKTMEQLDLAIAKVQFVQVYLADSSMPLPPEPSEPRELDMKPVSSEVSILITPGAMSPETKGSTNMLVAQTQTLTDAAPTSRDELVNRSGLDRDSTEATSVVTNNPTSSSVLAETPAESLKTTGRPQAPVPTRSTLAQSSFAWMLEQDEPPTSNIKYSSPKTSSPFLPAGKPVRSGPNREKTAFLFGDDTPDILDPITVSKWNTTQADQETGFVLGTMKAKKSK